MLDFLKSVNEIKFVIALLICFISALCEMSKRIRILPHCLSLRIIVAVSYDLGNIVWRLGILPSDVLQKHYAIYILFISVEIIGEQSG